MDVRRSRSTSGARHYLTAANPTMIKLSTALTLVRCAGCTHVVSAHPDHRHLVVGAYRFDPKGGVVHVFHPVHQQCAPEYAKALLVQLSLQTESSWYPAVWSSPNARKHGLGGGLTRWSYLAPEKWSYPPTGMALVPDPNAAWSPALHLPRRGSLPQSLRPKLPWRCSSPPARDWYATPA